MCLAGGVNHPTVIWPGWGAAPAYWRPANTHHAYCLHAGGHVSTLITMAMMMMTAARESGCSPTYMVLETCLAGWHAAATPALTIRFPARSPQPAARSPQPMPAAPAACARRRGHGCPPWPGGTTPKVTRAHDAAAHTALPCACACACSVHAGVLEPPPAHAKHAVAQVASPRPAQPSITHATWLAQSDDATPTTRTTRMTPLHKSCVLASTMTP